MADYFAQTVIQPTISEADMTPLERLLLTHIFQYEPDGDGLYFFADTAPDDGIVLSVAEVRAALSVSPIGADEARSLIDVALNDTGPDDEEIDVDLSVTSWEFIFQQIVRRSRTLAHVTAITSFTCSKMRPDGFGGLAVLITADAIQGKSTDDFIGDMLDQLEHGPVGVAPGYGVHVLVRLIEASVRAAVPEVMSDDPDLTITADDVTDADITAACLAVLDHTDVSDLQGLAVFNAALHAIREAGQRRAPKV